MMSRSASVLLPLPQVRHRRDSCRPRLLPEVGAASAPRKSRPTPLGTPASRPAPSRALYLTRLENLLNVNQNPDFFLLVAEKGR